MRDQNKCILIIQKIALQPCDMFLIQVVGRLIQKQDIRFFQKEFSEKDFCSLSATQVCNITVKSQIQKPECSCNFFDFGINNIKIM